MNLKGKNAVITGGSSGIGFETARFLCQRGVQVYLAVRDPDKGWVAEKEIKSENPEASIESLVLDLADLESIQFFAESFSRHAGTLDLLINNAGVMVPPYQKTRDGFELQFGTNHLGHFALTGHLLPHIAKTSESRVITLSSLAHRKAEIDFDNLDGENGYRAMKFYGQSKLANLLFALELDERFKKHGIQAKSIACHPGIAVTNLFKIGRKDAPGWLKKAAAPFLQTAEMGALPVIYAAENENLNGGEYIGPDGRGSRKGFPVIETVNHPSRSDNTGKRLWEVSEEMTGVSYLQ
ncbi:oxidoreductase [Peribacillus sp. SCS-37]|uniref:oxidoreductase n=1 Tax=Paraperibacillus esterisolvens TaxID=3115296 RepID=UPI0039058DED